MKKLLILSALVALAACSPSNQAQQSAPAAEQAAPVATEQAAPAQQAPVANNEITVNYACTAEGKKIAVTAVYAAQGDDLVSVKLTADGKEYPVLPRNTNNKEENEFADDKYTWVTDVATAQNVATQSPNMLTEKGTSTVNGENLPTDNILFKYCEISANP